mmetsp:Transcript_5816/g.14237  ORF Transcript_5816/g.14237 Transcript_5816/m.14237 type:complete len:299 (-) Transcript_5816:337-1233(-)
MPLGLMATIRPTADPAPLVSAGAGDVVAGRAGALVHVATLLRPVAATFVGGLAAFRTRFEAEKAETLNATGLVQRAPQSHAGARSGPVVFGSGQGDLFASRRSVWFGVLLLGGFLLCSLRQRRCTSPTTPNTEPPPAIATDDGGHVSAAEAAAALALHGRGARGEEGGDDNLLDARTELGAHSLRSHTVNDGWGNDDVTFPPGTLEGKGGLGGGRVVQPVLDKLQPAVRTEKVTAIESQALVPFRLAETHGTGLRCLGSANGEGHFRRTQHLLYALLLRFHSKLLDVPSTRLQRHRPV